MKKDILILIIFLLAFTDIFACGPYDRNSLAEDYYTFRACAENMSGTKWSLNEQRKKENCIAWANLTSKGIPLKEIEEVVYKWSIDCLEQLNRQIKKSENHKITNLFAKWLMLHKDYEIIDFLCVAKTCEKIRASQNTLWYYPVKGDKYDLDFR